MIKIAVFSSGSGSNAEALIRHFQDHPAIRVTLVVTNRKEAGVRERAGRLGLPHVWFPNAAWSENPDSILAELRSHQIRYILLAGFLRLIPPAILSAFPDRILNIHPALLPRFGGLGMHGIKVHEAVCRSGESESGLTIHLVNEEYDEGKILFQARCRVEENDTPAQLASRILQLEHLHYPQIADHYIASHQVSNES